MANKKGKTTESKSWTVLVVGELGKMKRFRLPKALLLLLIGSVAAFCAVAAVAAVLYHSMRIENVALMDDIKGLQAQLLAAEAAKEGAEVRLMVLANKGKKTAPKDKKRRAAVTPEEPKKKKKSVADEPQPKSPKKSKPGKKPQPKPAIVEVAKKPIDPVREKKPFFTTSEAAKEPTGASREASKPKKAPTQGPLAERKAVGPAIDRRTKQKILTAAVTSPGSVTTDSLVVDNLELRSQASDRSVKFQFSLKNVDATGRKISGYTFVVLKPVDGSQEPPRGSPWTPIEEGKPTIFKRGQYFSISRFKYVRGTIPQIQDVKRFDSATVYVFTEAGEIVLEKVFPITTVLKT